MSRRGSALTRPAAADTVMHDGPRHRAFFYRRNHEAILGPRFGCGPVLCADRHYGARAKRRARAFCRCGACGRDCRRDGRDRPIPRKPYASASAACLAALEHAAVLSAQGQWKSALQALDDFDKDNADPYALAMKTSLVLRGAVRRDMDRSFRLVDLQQGQDLESLSNSEGITRP